MDQTAKHMIGTWPAGLLLLRKHCSPGHGKKKFLLKNTDDSQRQIETSVVLADARWISRRGRNPGSADPLNSP
jgi:hypothetical protein